MIQYQNVGFSSGLSQFIETSAVHPVEANFRASRPVVQTSKGPVPMVKGSVVGSRETPATVCGESCPPLMRESFRIEFSILKGGDLASLRSEVIRLLDVALDEYHLASGLVPPAYADFKAEE